MPTAQQNRSRSRNSDFIRVRKTFLYGLLIAVAALFLLCLILMISTSSANKKLKEAKAAPEAVATTEADVPTSYTTLPAAVTTAPTTATAATVGKQYIVTTKSSNLNIRSEPNEDSAIVSMIPRNTEITITMESNGWGNVNYYGSIGWVLMEHLTPATETTAAVGVGN